MPAPGKQESTGRTHWPTVFAVFGTVLSLAVVVTFVLAWSVASRSHYAAIETAAAEYGIVLSTKDANTLESTMADHGTIPVRIDGEVVQVGLVKLAGGEYALVDADGDELTKR
ncbi:hypothetical protein [Leifsonia sp. Leaf264]|uniref:hypothetical protein n=1 Tax=Leifsonia sp. Leaf264 TaxID=1736314 RepID=UPI0006FB8A72|nr:hypothetical protein [Leifsonia sp. Leaf264]KQO98639.1 hypothetical protein ASF30_11290 [Leifsonia sp. Leaf264]